MTNKTHDNDPNVFRPRKLTTDDIREGCLYLTNGDQEETRICVVNEELRQGIDFIDQWDKSVTFFGSARTEPGTPYYEKARSLAKKIADLGYAIVTGGGPGIMQAGNQGAYEAKGTSVGMTIRLPQEQFTNQYVSDELPFYYFFTRKVAMSYSAEVYIVFPGGYGTMDEFFEMITLKQTGRIAPVPIVLVGEEFWGPLDSFIKSTLRDSYKTISPDDTDLYIVTDDEDTIIDIVKNAPVREND